MSNEKDDLENFQRLFKEISNTTTVRGAQRFETSDTQALMYSNSSTYHGRILRIGGTIQSNLTRRDRFNQDLDESVKEIRQKPQRPDQLSQLLLKNET